MGIISSIKYHEWNSLPYESTIEDWLLVSTVVPVCLAGIGASGALYGLLLLLIVDRLVAMKKDTGRRRFILMQLSFLVLLPILSTILIIIIYKFTVAHSAHVGGGLVGFLLGIAMLGSPLPWNDEHCIFRMTCRSKAFVFLFIFYGVTLTIFLLKDAPVLDHLLA